MRHEHGIDVMFWGNRLEENARMTKNEMAKLSNKRLLKS